MFVLACAYPMQNVLDKTYEFFSAFDLFCLFVFVALRPMSTAMVIAGRSVHLTTLFLGRLEQAFKQ